ncbi:hypothetical protein [Spirosoma sp.]|uniref:hypothetical protein n=1 Tax=Spirosoma sp. TaxID=1899569 RepID=UPI003B3B3D0C
MSSSDDPFDKKLRKHFQDVFDDFEVQPSTSLKERIWQHVSKPVATRQFSLLILGLLLLLGAGFFYKGYYSRLHSYQRKAQRIRVSNVAPPVEPQAQAKQPDRHYSHRFAESTDSETLRPTKERKRSGADAQLASPTLEPLVTTTPKKQYVAQAQSQTEQRSRMTGQRIEPRYQSGLASVTTFDEKTTQDGTRAARSPMLPTSTPEGTPSTPLILPEIRQKSDAEKAVSWQLLQPLSLRSAGEPIAQINRNVEISTPTVSAERPIRPRTSVRWLVGVAPLSTYQLMTVVDKPDTYVQRVDAPAAFSGATWGYQLRAGIEWRQYDFELSFGQIRRWAYYDLATSTFQVELLGTNRYQVTRLEKPVAENVSLTMIGAGISKQYQLGGAKSRYFTRMGGDISYVPDTRQSLIWAKATVGVTFPLLKTYQLQIGPTVEYGFSRIWSTERQLIIRPYLVGASITIRPNTP